jgi:hypothetical protein
MRFSRPSSSFSNSILEISPQRRVSSFAHQTSARADIWMRPKESKSDFAKRLKVSLLDAEAAEESFKCSNPSIPS